MNDKKQIEEMAKDVWKASCAGHGIECTKCEYANNSTDEYSCVDFVISQNLYNADYRKQSKNTVEVVRCKDCEYWTEVSFDAITEWHWGECKKPLGDYRGCDTAEHDFCSYGKPRMKGGVE